MRRAGTPGEGLQPLSASGRGRSRRPHRLDRHMAKKRVHEIAKQRGMPSKEVIAILQKAGLDVKTAAQSVDENDIAMAFNGGKKPDGAPQTADGGQSAAEPAPPAQPQQSAPQQ